MTNYAQSVIDFHLAFGVPVKESPSHLLPEDYIRRLSLIASENGELNDAVREKNLVEIADALGDLLYVVFGMAVEMGLPIDEVFRQIHESNMSKLDDSGKAIKDAGGKVLKSKNYKPVDLSWLEKNIH